MRTLLAAACLASAVTFVTGLALHAPNETVAVAAVAGVTALAAWLSSSHSTQERAGLALSNPAWTLTLVLRGRRGYADLLPLWASQVVGALAAGLALGALNGRLPQMLLWPSADAVTTAVVALVLGVLTAWTVAASDTYLTEGLTAMPVLGAAAALPLNLAGVLNPASVFGITVAGLLDWRIALIAAVAVIVAAAAGAWSARLVLVSRD